MEQMAKGGGPGAAPRGLWNQGWVDNVGRRAAGMPPGSGRQLMNGVFCSTIERDKWAGQCVRVAADGGRRGCERSMDEGHRTRGLVVVGGRRSFVRQDDGIWKWVGGGSCREMVRRKGGRSRTADCAGLGGLGGAEPILVGIRARCSPFFLFPSFFSLVDCSPRPSVFFFSPPNY